MSDLDAIRGLVHRYADAVCGADHDRWLATWSEDAVWEIGRGPTVGRDQIGAAFARAMSLFESVVQLVHNGQAEVEGDRGSGRWYMSEVSRTRSGKNLLYLGAYDDHYVRTDGTWRFARRQLNWHYQGPADLSGTFGPPPGYYRC